MNQKYYQYSHYFSAPFMFKTIILGIIIVHLHFSEVSPSPPDKLLIKMDLLLHEAAVCGNKARILESKGKYPEALKFYLMASDKIDDSIGIAERKEIPIENVAPQAFYISGLSHYDVSLMGMYLSHRFSFIDHHLKLSRRSFSDLLKRENIIKEAGVRKRYYIPLAQVYFLLGNISSIFNDLETARTYYLRALSVDPLYRPAKKRLYVLDYYFFGASPRHKHPGIPDLPDPNSFDEKHEYNIQINIILSPDYRRDEKDLYQGFIDKKHGHRFTE